MITVCCVCGKILKDDNVKDHLVSHGMCQECADKERECFENENQRNKN